MTRCEFHPRPGASHALPDSPPQVAAIRRRARHSRTSGLTLVEVMVGMVVIGTTALAALSALLFSWRVSNANLCTLLAHATATSVAEEIQALGFSGLDPHVLPIDVPSVPGGSLNVGVWNNRTEDFRNTPANPADDLKISIKPEFVTGVAAGSLEIAQVIVRYRWTERSFLAERTREESITFAMTSASAF